MIAGFQEGKSPKQTFQEITWGEAAGFLDVAYLLSLSLYSVVKQVTEAQIQREGS